MTNPVVYGIGNPLVDVSVSVDDNDINALGLAKGTMNLIDTEKRRRILEYIGDKPVNYGCGGSSPNTMIALSALGVSTALGGSIADDELGRIYHDRLAETGVRNCMAANGQETGTSIILVTPDGERTMCTFLGACMSFSKADVFPEVAASARWLHFTAYMFDTENQWKALEHAIETIKTSGGRVSFDCADPFAVERHRDRMVALIPEDVDLLFANQAEAETLTGVADPAKAAGLLAEQVSIVAVKDGKNGSIVACRNTQKPDAVHVTRIAAYPARLVDSNGAGDTYAAAFLSVLIERDDFQQTTIRQAGDFASYLSAKIVERSGAQFSLDEPRTLRDEYLQRK